MEATASNNPPQFGPTAVYAPGFAMKFFISFTVALIGAFALFLLVMAVGAFSRGGEMAVMAIFFVAIAGVQLLLMRYMWPFLDATWRLRIEIGAGQASFRLPARRTAPLQPAYAFALPLPSIEKLATRIELIRSMGQIQQMRRFALKANGVWIEYGGVIENSYNGMVGATGKAALASVAALQHATGLQVEDHGVIEAAKKGEAGTPWGGVSLAAPVAEVALVQAGKNANMWRNILIGVAFVVLAIRLLTLFVR
ncbi:MAG: hypothetical protein SGJ23_06320 [Alphaproteobacteria bacterium]|nr:hypothetical protein [Alphaproteobacteria bacterium]